MRIFLVCMMTGMLLVTVGCGVVTQSVAAEQASPQDEISQTQQDAPIKIEETARGNRPAENNENMQMGKIVSVSENEITVALAAIQRPERSAADGSAPTRQRENSQEERKRPEGSRQPEDSRAPNGGGRGFGGQMEFTYSGEQKTYALTENVKITKSMGEKSEALAIADLVKDDVVRLELDESGALISVQLWNMSADTGNKAADAQD